MSDYDKAAAGDYPAIASRLRAWAADIETHLLVLDFADTEDVQDLRDATTDMLALARALDPKEDA